MTNFTSDSRVGRVLLLPAGLLACSLFTPFTVTAKNNIPVTISQQVRTKIQVNGTVTDATGEPLIGATVLEKPAVTERLPSRRKFQSGSPLRCRIIG